jgi:hypothetical protein
VLRLTAAPPPPENLLPSPELIAATFAGCTDSLEKKQLAYLLARHGALLPG